MNNRIAIIMPEGIQYDYCIQNFLNEGLNVKLIVRLNRNKISGLVKFKKTIKYLSYYKYNLDNIKNKNEREARKILKDALKINISNNNLKGIEILQFNNFNQEILVSKIKEFNIDFCCIWGCPILKSIVINSVSNKIINAHTSILPHFKGSFSEFWQFYHRDFSNAGVTFHEVDSGVDTGNVIFQLHALDSECINPQLLRAYNSIRIAKNYANIVRKYINSELISFKQNQENKTTTYKIKDMSFEKQSEVYLNNIE
jgi:folate-dependent phosphoribosylglycinamide formyltransferase PurN